MLARTSLALVLALCSAACSDDKPVPDDTDDTRSDDGAPSDDDQGDDSSAAARDAGPRLDARARDDAPQARDASTLDADGLDVGERDARVDEADANLGRRDAGADAGADAGRDAGSATMAPGMTPAFHVPLRVHRADSGLTGAVLAQILEEVNEIWWKQAGVCFEIEIVRNESVRSDGFDLWFHRSKLGCNATANGVYCGDHDVHSLDAPSLNRADDPAWTVRRLPARTAAHELGHGLRLQHYDGFPDSNDSLMSSGRQGFKLHAAELETARTRARAKALADSPTSPCAAVPIVD